jgi:homocitrate synthase NifV
LTLNKSCGIDAHRFRALSLLVARASGRAVPLAKPITGAGIFRHESGIHVRGLLSDRRTYEPFAAESVGRRGAEIVLGKHSGAAAVRQVLADEGIRIGADEAAGVLAHIRASAAQAKCLSASV